MIACPSCGTKSIVKDVRPAGDSLRRRRLCSDCGSRWTTVEIGLDQLRAIERKARPERLTDADRAAVAAILPLLERLAKQ